MNTTPAVDNVDWLKTIAITLVAIDHFGYFFVEDADWCMRMKALGYRCWYAHRARLWHMVSPTTGGYKPGRTFNTGRATAIFIRRFASVWQKLTFFLFLAAAIPAAFLRELPSGNQAAALAKLRGAIAGWKVRPGSPPEFGDGA